MPKTPSCGRTLPVGAQSRLQQFATPFVSSVMGYSGHGKSYTPLGVDSAPSEPCTHPCIRGSYHHEVHRGFHLSRFEGTGTGDCANIAYSEESENRVVLNPDLKRGSAMFAVENGYVRSLLVELATEGSAGFWAGSVY